MQWWSVGFIVGFVVGFVRLAAVLKVGMCQVRRLRQSVFSLGKERQKHRGLHLADSVTHPRCDGGNEC